MGFSLYPIRVGGLFPSLFPSGAVRDVHANQH